MGSIITIHSTPLVTKRANLVYVGLVHAGLVALVPGCGGDQSESILADLIGSFTTPTPTEAALDMFNLYDADKRCRGVNLIADSPFGGEPEYVRLYRLLLGRTATSEKIPMDKEPIVQAAAIRALARHGDVDDVELILPLLTESNSFYVRWEAVKALQRIHNHIAVEPLVVAMLNDSDHDVRSAAAFALGQYPVLRVFDALVGALSDRNYGVVESAHQSLCRLTGNDYGAEGTDWLMWAEDRRATLFEFREPYSYVPFRDPPNLSDKLGAWAGKRRTPPKPQRPIGYPG